MNTISEIPLASIVDHPDQPRYGEGDVEALAASIDAVGQLEPVILVLAPGPSTMSPTYAVLAGHRRTAALRKLERQTVRAMVLEGVTREAAVKAIMASNTAREALTPLEEARGYQTMIELGIPVATVAKIAGAKKKHVDRLSTAIKQLGRERSDALAAKEPQLSIEHMEGLAKFTGERYEKLVKVLEEKPDRFASELRNAEWDLKQSEAREAAIAKVREAGVTVIETVPATGEYLSNLVDRDDEPLKDEAHAGCPGHAAKFSFWSNTPCYVCTDWRAHGHKQRYAGGTNADWEKQRAERQARREALEQLATGRRAFVSGLLQQTELHGGLHYFAVQYVWDDCLDYITGVDRLLALQLLGWEYDETGKRRWVQSEPESLPANISGDEVARALTAVLVANIESGCADWSEEDAVAVKYLRLLKGAGYELSELEHAIAWPPKDEDEEPAEEAVTVDPETGEVDGPAVTSGWVMAVYPDGDALPTDVGEHTQYAELIADYLAHHGGNSDTLEDFRVVAERELADPEKEYGRREPHDIIWSGDYGQRLRVVAADQGSVHGS